MWPLTVSDYYRNAIERLRAEVLNTPDAQVLAMDPEEWVTHLIDRYSMETVEVDPSGPMRMVETSLNGYPAVRVLQPLVWTGTLDVISREGLAGHSAWLGFDYKRFFDNHYQGTMGLTVTPRAEEINGAKGRIAQYIQSLNGAINQENPIFSRQAREIVTAKRTSIGIKHQHLDDLAATVGIPLVKRADVSTIIPTAVRVRQKVAPLVPPEPKAQQRRVLEQDKFDAIIELLDNQCRQFERTPAVFQTMGEEPLRDVMLSSLNAVFEGAAAGEVFQGLGKTDIHLRISQGEVFIAEIKIWDGPSSLATVVAQLLERLTWRDAYGVVTIISRNADFSGVLASIEAALPHLPGAIQASLAKQAPNVFMARFSLPSDSSTPVEIHVRAYNVYTSRPSGRAA